ncbi:hypothetical protein F4815DRAFT_455721 [Daldinia loculata]|nr:hypothetical protein F4815DRAFT_455721 [Daldinia loculata]
MTPREEVDMDPSTLSYEEFTDGSVSARQFSVNIHNINNVTFIYGGRSPDNSQNNAPDNSQNNAPRNLPYNGPFTRRYTFDHTNPPSPEEKDPTDFLRNPNTGEWVRRGWGGERRHDNHSRNFERDTIPQKYTFPDVFRQPRPQPPQPPQPQPQPQPPRPQPPRPYPLPPIEEPLHIPTEVPDEIPAWAAASRNTIFSRPRHLIPPKPINPVKHPKQPSYTQLPGQFRPLPRPEQDTDHRTGDGPSSLPCFLNVPPPSRTRNQ